MNAFSRALVYVLLTGAYESLVEMINVVWIVMNTYVLEHIGTVNAARIKQL